MKNLLAIFLLFLFTQLNAQNIVNFDGLCAVVSSLREETNISNNLYAYQTKILDFAEVKIDDNENEIRKKVQLFWKKNQHRLICDSPDFNVPNGSVIKLAVARRFEDFIDDVTETWKIDFNYLDKSDNKTILDYVQSEMEKQKGTPIELILNRYYKKFRDAGAKHKSEL